MIAYSILYAYVMLNKEGTFMKISHIYHNNETYFIYSLKVQNVNYKLSNWCSFIHKHSVKKLGSIKNQADYANVIEQIHRVSKQYTNMKIIATQKLKNVQDKKQRRFIFENMQLKYQGYKCQLHVVEIKNHERETYHNGNI